MSSELEYLRTKDKYLIDINWRNSPRLIEIFEGFGRGVYWHQPNDQSKDNMVKHEAWLTPEELTTLKILIPQITFTKIT